MRTQVVAHGDEQQLISLERVNQREVLGYKTLVIPAGWIAQCCDG